MKAFVVTVAVSEVDLASERLWSLGVRGIEERTVDAGSAQVEPTRVELWTAVGDDPGAIEAAGAAMRPGWHWRVVDVDAEPADTWRRFARPVVVRDRIVLAPAWVDDADLGGGVDGRDLVVVRIEPGAAFGLGDHPTTQLSLGLLVGELDRTVRTDARTAVSRSVLDVGCGTGVLGIAAARLGASAVRCIDTSAAAVEATRDNARRNAVHRLDVDDTPLEQVEERFDVVVANILAPTLRMLAADLLRTTRPGGALIISGVLEGRHNHVLRALEPFAVEATEVLDGWAAVRLRAR